MTEAEDIPELTAEFFEKAERGKFYRPNAVFHYPVYLEPELLEFFSHRAHRQGLDLEHLLNQILTREMTGTAGQGSRP